MSIFLLASPTVIERTGVAHVICVGPNPQGFENPEGLSAPPDRSQPNCHPIIHFSLIFHTFLIVYTISDTSFTFLKKMYFFLKKIIYLAPQSKLMTVKH
jgi:hypothetical protein